jgi:putative PIN family toxin of toxin-antitoxin system
MRYHCRVKVVLDTSVIVAATRSDSGASRQVLLAGLASRFEPLLSVALALEYEAVLKRPEQLAVSGATMEEIDKLLNALIVVAIPVYRSFFWRPLLPDANDDLVLEAALSGHADLLVTFNRRDFEIAQSAWGVLVVTPQQALKLIRRTDEKE